MKSSKAFTFPSTDRRQSDNCSLLLTSVPSSAVMEKICVLGLLSAFLVMSEQPRCSKSHFANRYAYTWALFFRRGDIKCFSRLY